MYKKYCVMFLGYEFVGTLCDCVLFKIEDEVEEIRISYGVLW